MVFDPEVHSCLDGVLCPYGFSRCTNPDNGVYACFDPNADPAYGCKNGNVVQLKDAQTSDSTEIKYCANSEQSKRPRLSLNVEQVSWILDVLKPGGTQRTSKSTAKKGELK